MSEITSQITSAGAWMPIRCSTLMGRPTASSRSLLGQSRVQVAPPGVFLLDQTDLPSPIPFLDPSFAFERLLAGLMLFEPDENMNAIFCREAPEPPLLVLLHPV